MSTSLGDTLLVQVSALPLIGSRTCVSSATFVLSSVKGGC